jgi:RND family efflux transporter MFP subunit
VVTLVRQDPVRIRVEIPERLAPKIRVGQPIQLTVQGRTARHAGRVVRLSPALEAQSRSLVVEGEIPNKDGALRPGSFAEVVITVDPHASGIAVPRDSVLSFAGTDRVFIARGDRLDDRIVRIGRSLEGDKVEIVTGLEPGMKDGRLSKGQKVLAR